MAGETTGLIIFSHRSVFEEIHGPAYSRLWRPGYLAALVEKHVPLWVITPIAHAAKSFPEHEIIMCNPDLGGPLEMNLMPFMASIFSQNNIEELVQWYKAGSNLDLFYSISIKEIDLKELKSFKVVGDRIEAPRPVKSVTTIADKPEITPYHQLPKKDTELIIFGERSDKVVYNLANCCKPIPGDDVFGFVTTGKGLTIHRTSCPNAAKLLASYGHRVVKTKWAKNKEISFLTGIKIVGLDDVGVVSMITNLISGELKINIAALTIEAKEGLFMGNIRLYVHDKEELERLVQALLGLPGVESVERYDMEDIPS